MFETHDSAKLPFFANIGEHYWSYVGIHFQHAWLHATYINTSEEDCSVTETIILSRVSQLIELSKREHTTITFVDLASPGYMNGSTRWKMEPLHEIWLCASHDHPNQQAHVFLLENGMRYEDVGPETLGIQFFENQLIFSTPLT